MVEKQPASAVIMEQNSYQERRIVATKKADTYQVYFRGNHVRQ